MKTMWWTLRQICRDGEGEGAGTNGGTSTDGGAGAGGAGGSAKSFTQDEVNALLAKERRTLQNKLNEQITTLEAIKKDGLTPEAKAALEQQIEALRNQTATTEELAKQQLEKRKREWETTEKQLREELATANARYEDLQVQTLFGTAMGLHGVKPGATGVISAYLRSNLQKVPVVDELGKPTGQSTYVVNVETVSSEGQRKVLQLTPDKAVAQLREHEDFAALFASPAKSGLGGSAGTIGNVDVKNLSQLQYMELRKTNPQALGLRTQK